MRERGATIAHVRDTVLNGTKLPAKFGRTKFRRIHPFGKTWNAKYYPRQQIEVFATTIPDGWLVVTVIVKYF